MDRGDAAAHRDVAEQRKGKQFSGALVSGALLSDGCDRCGVLFTRDAGCEFKYLGWTSHTLKDSISQQFSMETKCSHGILSIQGIL